MQDAHNQEHGIVPQTVTRAPEAVMVEPEEIDSITGDLQEAGAIESELPRDIKECRALTEKVRSEMFALAKQHEFEKAAVLRDRVAVLEKYLLKTLNPHKNSFLFKPKRIAQLLLTIINFAILRPANL